MATIYDDLIPKGKTATEDRPKEPFLVKAARAVLPRKAERAIGIPDKPIKFTPPPEPVKPKLSGSIYDDLLPGYKEPKREPTIPTIPTSPLVSGNLPPLVVEPEARKSFISQAPTKTRFQKFKDVIKKPFVSLEENVAKDQAVYAIWKNINENYYLDLADQLGVDGVIPSPLVGDARRKAKIKYVEDRIDELTAEFGIPKEQISSEEVRENFDDITKALGLRQIPTAEELVAALFMIPVTSALLLNPISALVGLATFAAIDEVENFVISMVRKRTYQFQAGQNVSDLLPENVNDLTREVVELLDFMAKAKALHVTYKKTPGVIDKFTKDITTTYNLPKTVYIEGAKIKSIFQTGEKISPAELKLVQELGLTAKQYRAAIQTGIAIEVPIEKVVRITDTPYWAKLKQAIRLTPTEPEVRLDRQRVKQAPRALLAEPKPAEPVEVPKKTIFDDLVPKKVKITEARKLELTKLNEAVVGFDKTGTADVITGENFGISIKDEGEFVSVRFGSNKLTSVGEFPSGERNFATKTEAFDFVKQLQEKVKIAEAPTEPVKAPSKNEATIREAYGKKEGTNEHLSQIFIELDIAEAGRRVRVPAPEEIPGDARFIAEPSTFPDWIPDHLRDRKLFDTVMENLKDTNKLSYPTGNRSKQRELYNTILEELDRRTGVDTSKPRNAIMRSYDEFVAKIEVKEEVRGRAPRGEGRGEKEPATIGGGGEAASKGIFREGVPIKLGNIDNIRPAEFPELVELARDLIGTPGVVKRFRSTGKKGEFSAFRGVRISADMFKKGNERQLAALLAHEIGHLFDYLPSKTLKRGNLLGRLQTLDSFRKGTFTTEDGREIKNKDIRKELKEVSNFWRPWDEATASPSFKQYRNSGVELYADAISMLFNNPGMLESMAPKFYSEFFLALDKKPNVKSAYFELQEILSGTRAELVERRRGGVRRMFEEGDYKAIELQKQKMEEKKESKKNLMLRLKIQLVDKNFAVIDKVKALEKQGVVIPEDENPIYFLEERTYMGGEMKAFTEKNFEPVYLDTQKAGIDWLDFGEALFYERIIAGDRSEVANPRGLSPDNAKELYQNLKSDLGTEKVKILEDNIKKFREGVKIVAEEAFKEGLYTEELHKQMEKNPAYATFQVVEHLEQGVTSKIYKQIGTLKDIVNPADATIMKTLVTKREIEKQKVKKSVFKFLEENYRSEIEDAKEIFTGRGLRPIESKDPNQKLIYFYDKGRIKGKYVDPYIADSINNVSIGRNFALVESLRWLNSGLFRPLFITFNLGFQTFNLLRDFQRFWKNTPDMTMFRAIKRYWQSVPASKARAFALPKNPSAKDLEAYKFIQEAEEVKIISVTFNDIILERGVGDKMIEDILGKMGVGGFTLEKPRWWAKPFVAVLEGIKRLGDFVETLPKAAGIFEYRGDGTIADIKPSERSFIRRKIGSPDFLAGGTYKPVTNEVFLFSNAIIQGIRADIEVATRPKTRSGFWWKTAKINIVPKLMMFGAMLGLFGDKAKEMMNSASEYDRTNYTIIPLGVDEDGNTVYFRLPQDETGRFIGGMFWKVLMALKGDTESIKSIQQVLSYTGGQLPSVTPSIELLISTSQFLSGRNPYDFFRGRSVLTEDEFKARDFRTLKKFLGWEFQQLGGGIIWKFYAGEQRPREQSVGQFILKLPIISNVIGRFIKISNYGQVEQFRTEIGEVQKEEARVRLDERAAINDAIRQYMELPGEDKTPSAIRQMARDIADTIYAESKPGERLGKRVSISKKINLGIVRGAADPVIDALFSATSNDQKIAVLLKAAETMTTDEMNKFLRETVRQGIISGEVSHDIRKKLNE